MHRTGLFVAALAAVCLSLAARGVRAEEPVPGATQEVVLSDDCEKFRVPSDWKIEKTRPVARLDCWRVALPGDLGSATLLAGRFEAAREELVATASLSWGKTGGVFETKPIPLAVVPLKAPDGSDWVGFNSVRMAKRRGFLLQLQVPKASSEKVRSVFVAAVKSFESARSDAPDVPDSYKFVARDGYLYRLHPDVPDTAVAPLHKLLLSVEGPIAKRYGAIPKSAANPLVIVVHAKAADAAGLCDDAAKDPSGTEFDHPNGTLYTVPLPKDDWFAVSVVAQSWTFALLDQVFGVHFQGWLFTGEAMLSSCELSGGRTLPQFDERWAGEIPKTLTPFGNLVQESDGSRTPNYSAMVFVAFFRSAGKPYSDAFAAYAKQIRAGTNPTIALEKTLLALDQEKLHAAASAFLATFKAVKAK